MFMVTLKYIPYYLDYKNTRYTKNSSFLYLFDSRVDHIRYQKAKWLPRDSSNHEVTNLCRTYTIVTSISLKFGVGQTNSQGFRYFSRCSSTLYKKHPRQSISAYNYGQQERKC